MGNQDKGCALFSAQRKEQVDYLRTIADIEVASWFIGKEVSGCYGKGTGKCHALLFPSRERFGAVFQPMGKANSGQPGAGPCFGVVFALEPQGQRDIFPGGEVRQKLKILEDEGGVGKPPAGSLLFAPLR